VERLLEIVRKEKKEKEEMTKREEKVE